MTIVICNSAIGAYPGFGKGGGHGLGFWKGGVVDYSRALATGALSYFYLFCR